LRHFSVIKTINCSDLYFYGLRRRNCFCNPSHFWGDAMIQIISLLLGSLFGGGLYLAGMTNPKKVLNFMDIMGNWDPSLIFVMAGAIPVAAIGYRLMLCRAVPIIFNSIQIPSIAAVDARLVIGSLIFGVGWGISGLCPGPAFATVLIQPQVTAIYLVALIAGSLAYKQFHR
jgi:uncharacterized membrane protein YedE/YeeE